MPCSLVGPCLVKWIPSGVRQKVSNISARKTNSPLSFVKKSPSGLYVHTIFFSLLTNCFVAFVRDILLCDFVWTTRTRRIVWNFVNRRKVFGLTHKISFCSVTFCQLGKFRGKPCFCAGSCNISSSVFRNWPAAKWHPHHAGFQQNSFPGSYRLGCFLFKDIAEI